MEKSSTIAYSKHPVSYEKKKEGFLPRAPRYPITADLALKEPGFLFSRPVAVKTHTDNISAGGMRFISPEPLAANHPYVAVLRHAKSRRTLRLRGKIVYTNETFVTSGLTLYKMGFQFTGIGKRRRKRIEAWIQTVTEK